MARSRNIKPGFYKNEDLAECSIWARFIFPGLWMLADRDGRLEDRPKRIKAELLAFDSQDVDPLLNELQGRGFLVRYRNSDGSFIQISKFSSHQNPHYSEKASTIKPPELPETSGHEGGKTPGFVQEKPESATPIKRGSQPPDSLIPETLERSSPSGSRLSLSALPDEWAMYCSSKRPDLTASDVWENFRDYWAAKPGKEGRKADWFATWRQWVRKEKEQPKKTDKPSHHASW